MTPLILYTTAGSVENYVLQIINRVTGLAPTAGQYLGSDSLLATVSTGQNSTSVLFNPSCSWNNADTGLINVGIPAGQTTAYDTTGDYWLQITDTTQGEIVISCKLRIFPAIGYSTTPNDALATYENIIDAWPAYANLPASRQTQLLKTASSKIKHFCRRPDGFILQSFDEFYDGKNLPRIWLNHRPIVQVIAVNVNSYPLDNTYSTAWTFQAKSGALIRGQNLDDERFHPWFPKGQNNIEVVYAAGYNETPAEVIEAVIQYVRYLHDQAKQSGIYSAERIGDYNYTLNQQAQSMTLPQHIASLLADYVQDDGPL